MAPDLPSATGCTHPEAHRTSWDGDTCVRCSSEAQRLGRVVTPPDAIDPLDGESAFLAAMYAMAAEDHR